MTVSSTQPTTTTQTPASAPTAPANPSGDMGQDTFLKLLVEQLKDQDPMSPMQSQDMVAQLAQLSSVQQLTSINTALGQMQTSNNTAAGLQSSGLIGRNITANTNHLNLSDATKSPQGNYSLGAAAETVTVNVRDANSNIVRTMTLNSQTAGQKSFAWDGKADDGTQAPNANYTFDVTAKNVAGTPVQASTEASGLVTEVTYENGAPEVVVGGAHIPLGDVTSIAQ
jgi:flagellar basal-body rod modification protein FlgD